jgi:transposase
VFIYVSYFSFLCDAYITEKNRLLISAEHQQLLERYNNLVMRQYQHDDIVRKLREENARQSAEITTLKNVFDQLAESFKGLTGKYEDLLQELAKERKDRERLSLIEHQYEQLKKLLYGRSSEKSNQPLPGQLLLGLEAELVEACKMGDAQKVSAYTKYTPTNSTHPGRNKIPAHLPRVFVDIHPENLPEGAVQFGKEETEQLEYDPGKLFVTVYRRYKYKLDQPAGAPAFFIAPLPDEKDKSIAAPSLKASVTIEKYMYHTPIYRQIQKFSQEGIVISDTTMGDWINDTCRSLTALYEVHRRDIVYSASRYMMADETHMVVLDNDKPKGKKSHIGQMWAYCNPVDKLVFFEYQKGRGNKHAKPVLENFQGTLHTDGYGVYKHYGNRKGVTHACCNAHARRKFTEAKFTDKQRAEYAIGQYQKLYLIEQYCRDNNLSFDERKIIRQAKSVPIFEEMAAWVKEQLKKILSVKSPIGKALVYFAQREKELGMFLHDGMLFMDTNIIENTIRPIALGRKNYLFAGSHDAAQNAAIIYSLLATCKLHDVNPYDWLKHVLTVMPTFPASRIKELLPQNWKAEIM